MRALKQQCIVDGNPFRLIHFGGIGNLAIHEYHMSLDTWEEKNSRLQDEVYMLNTVRIN